ncbi:MAG: hypothetical protein HYY23_15745 [Verrucomicrobia bacterium]|nr:hypothetical protein [Verrucomicrobiota bacterium]
MTSAFCETLTIRSTPAGLKIYRSEKPAATAHIPGIMDSRKVFWENLSFLLLWLGGLGTIGYSFLTFMSLSGLGSL